MPIEVTMPKLSPTMESGVIIQWRVKVGDQVKEGDTLGEIETDKATMEMKAYDEGTVAHIDHAAGEEVPLGQRVLVLAQKGEDPEQVARTLGVGKGATAPATAPPPARGVVPEATDARKRGEALASRPAQTVPAAERARGNGPQQQPGPTEARPDAGRLKTSPLARKVAASAGVDLSQVRGTGPGGRIIRRDIEAFLAGAGQAPEFPAATPAIAPSVATLPAAPTAAERAALAPAAPPWPRPVAGPLAAERIPHSRMRKTIAQRMVQVKQAVPEIHLTVEVRADRLAAARAELNKRVAGEGIKLSLGDFVTKAVATSLRSHPALNASFEPDAIVRHGEINLGIAVALSEGLIVPVLRRADELGLREIRRQTEVLAAAARARTLTSEQLSGGTFTISNLGMYGIHQFDAIINLPEVAILAVGAAQERPVVDGDRLAVGTVMTLTVTADHRAVDGATAAEFLQTLKGLLEEPTAMLL